MKKVVLFTDGACSGNPGRGGWAALLGYQDKEKLFVGYSEQTTNIRMELGAFIGGLSQLKEACEVVVFSDSKFLVTMVEGRSFVGWAKDGWRRKDGGAVKNQDLWQRIWELTDFHKVKLNWLPSHTKKKDGSFDTSVKDFSYQSDSVVADVVSCLGETDEVRYIFSRNDLVDRAAVFAMKNEKEGVLDLDLFA